MDGISVPILDQNHPQGNIMMITDTDKDFQNSVAHVGFEPTTLQLLVSYFKIQLVIVRVGYHHLVTLSDNLLVM